jgi:hypothetical protein
MRLPLAVALLAAAADPAAAAAAQPITAGEFLARAEPLLKKSRVALMMSSDARELMRILGETADDNRKRLDADRAAGRPLSACLPPKGKASVDARELITYLRSISAAQRGQSFDRAFAGYAARKYPCR